MINQKTFKSKMWVIRISEASYDKSVDAYSMFNEGEWGFKTLKEISDFLDEHYDEENFFLNHYNEKHFMKMETKDGEMPTGIIFDYKNKDWSHDSEWWNQSDWIEIFQVEKKEIFTNINKIAKMIKEKSLSE